MSVTKRNRMSKTAFNRIKKRISDRNRRFKKMSPARKRVAIATDVISYLSNNGNAKLVACSGIYFEPEVFLKGKAEDQVQDHLIRLPSCTVCAKGALFVAAVLRHDDLTMAQLNDLEKQHGKYTAELGHQEFSFEDVASESMSSYMKKFFGRRQWDLIEKVFEDTINNKYANDDFEYEISHDHQDDRKRLIAIMKNIVKNNGTFKPARLKNS